MYFWYFHSMKHLNCHFSSFLIGVRRALPARSQWEKADWHVFTCKSALPNQNTTWSKTVSLLTLKSVLPWRAWSGVDEDTDGLNIPHPGHLWKANSYSLMYPPSSSLTIPRGQEFHSRWDISLGRAQNTLPKGIRAQKDQVSFPKNPLAFAW